MPKVPTIPDQVLRVIRAYQGDSGNSRLFDNQGYAYAEGLLDGREGCQRQSVLAEIMRLVAGTENVSNVSPPAFLSVSALMPCPVRF